MYKFVWNISSGILYGKLTDSLTACSKNYDKPRPTLVHGQLLMTSIVYYSLNQLYTSVV